MARTLGTLTVDLLLKAGAFESDAGRAARIADKEAKAMARSFDAAGKAIGLALAAGVATVATSVGLAINRMDDLSKAAQRANMPTEQFSALAHAADLADVSMEDLQKSMGKLAKAQSDALSGTSAQAKVFDSLGISVKNADGSLRNTTDVFMDFADRFKQFKGSPEIMAAGMDVFGKSFQNLVPLLKDGSGGLRDAMEEAKRLGLVLSTEAGRQAEEFNDNLTRLKSQAGGLGMSLAVELLPSLIEVTEIFRDGASEGGGFGDVFSFIGDQVRAAVEDMRGFIVLGKQIGIVAAEAMNQIGAAWTAYKNFASFGLADGTISGAWDQSKSGREAALRAMADAELYRTGTDRKKYTDQFKSQFSVGIPGTFNFAADQSGRAAGGSFNFAEDMASRATPAMEAATGAATRAAKAIGGVGKASDGAAKAAREHADAERRAADALEQTANVRADALRTLEDWTAQLAGPAADAALKYDRLEDDINAKMGAGAITAAEYAKALGLIQQMRERDPALISKQSAAAEAYAEEMKRQAEDLQGIFIGAATSATRAFGDFFARGFKGAKDLVRNLKDTFKRMLSDVATMFLDNAFVKPLQGWLQNLFNGAGQGGGFMQQGGPAGGMGQMFNGAMDKLTGFFGKLFGRGGAAQSAVEAGTGTAMDGWFGQLKQAGGLFSGGVTQAGGVMLPNGQVAGSSFSAMSPWMGAIGGAAMGWGMGGDTPGKIGGALAGGVAGYGLMAGAGAMSGAIAGGAGLMGAGAAGLAAIPVAGWIALAALAVNAIAGGKLFGTKFKTESGSQSFGISEAGATGSQSTTEVRQKSFFRGREWKTTTTGLDAEAMSAVNELFDALKKTVTTAANALGVDIPDLVGGSFKREFDSKGNLTREFGTIAGRVYNEAQEAFASRLVGENLLSVAKQAGSAAELEQLANAYRATGEELQSFATLALAVQADLKSANGIWQQAGGDGVMTRIVEYIEGIAKAGEGLADAYARVSQTIAQYGDLIGGVRQQIATRGLNQYQKAQLDVELAYRAQVKQANELAKALGLTGARSQDLAAIEQLRALNMADLQVQYAAQQQAQNQNWLQDLALSDLSPLRDDQKLAKVMELLRSSVAANDAGRSQKLAEQALGLGRDLYASGADYSALYGTVTGLIGDLQPETVEGLIGLTNEQLGTLADLMTDLPARIAQELAAVLVPTPPPVTANPALPPAPVPAPPTSPTPPSGGGGGYYDTPQCVAYDMFLDGGTRAIDARVGDLHDTLDPEHGHAVLPVRVVGAAVLQPCVRLVTDSGAALVCSRSTPFTDVDATVDTPEFTTLAPDMAGKRVFVQRGAKVTVEVVAAVQDAGDREVVPMDFAGRSFPAGEDRGALIYSHNMMKSSGGDLSFRMVSATEQIATTNQRMLAIEEGRALDRMAGTTRIGAPL